MSVHKKTSIILYRSCKEKYMYKYDYSILSKVLNIIMFLDKESPLYTTGNEMCAHNYVQLGVPHGFV